MAEGKTTGFNARIMWKNKIKKWKTGDKGEKVQREKNRREEVKGEEAQREERQMGKESFRSFWQRSFSLLLQEWRQI